jgi:hypothetical protein
MENTLEVLEMALERYLGFKARRIGHRYIMLKDLCIYCKECQRKNITAKPVVKIWKSRTS